MVDSVQQKKTELKSVNASELESESGTPECESDAETSKTLS